MNGELIVFATLFGTLVLFIYGRWRYDVVAILASTDAGNDSFIRSSAQLERSVVHVIATVHDALLTSENVAELIGKNADVMVASAEVTQIVSDLLFNVLLLEYEGPNDRLYVAERNHVITTLESFESKAGFLATDATTVFNENKDSITLPALVVDHVTISSDTTGGDTVTSSPEDFTLTAHVKNLSASAVSRLLAQVTVTSMEDVVVISTPTP